MSGRVYTVSANGVTLANAVVTLVFLNPSSTIGFRILRAWASQDANATSAQQRIQLVTQVTTFPTVVTATPSKHKLSDPAASLAGVGGECTAGKCGINASGEGAGAKTVIVTDAFNVLNGWLYIPTEREIIEINANAASGFGLYLPVAALTLTKWNFGVTYEEMG